MFRWFKRKKKQKPDYDAVIQENWKTDFSHPRRERFVAESGDGYDFEFIQDGALLAARRRHLFAWSENPRFRYSDSVIKGRFCWDSGDYRYSAGLLVRKNDDSNFYSFLVSRDGRFRFDLIFNGNPVVLVPWTSLVFDLSSETVLEVVAFGGYFILFVDGRWVAEVEDETLGSGKNALAVQNYGQSDESSLRWTSFEVEARPGRVESRYSTWTTHENDLTPRRRALAESFQEQGLFSAAVIQWKRVLAASPDDVQGHLLMGQALLALGLAPEAREVLEKVVDFDSESRDGWLGLSNAVMMTRDYRALEKVVRKALEHFDEDPWLLSLLSQALVYQGRREEACALVLKAAEAADDVPALSLNAAEALAGLGRGDEALKWALGAAGGAFGIENYEILDASLALVEEIDPDHPLVPELHGLEAFMAGNLIQARSLLEPLVRDSENSAVYYVWAMTERAQGRDESAEAWLKKAADSDPESAIYQLRLAEMMADRGLWDRAEEYLLRAEELDGVDGWTLNLRGQILLGRGESDKALPCFEEAFGRTGGSEDVLVNLSSALEDLGRYDEAVSRLQDADESAVIWNRLGNLAVAREDYHGATVCYRRAINMDPSNPVYKENCAGAWIEVDGFSHAEELLVWLAENSPSSSVFNKIGNMARLMGQFSRARAAYEAALSLDNMDVSVRMNLSELYFQQLQYDKAREVLDILGDECEDRVLVLREKIRRAVEMDLQCDTCGRIWRVPKLVEPQGVLRLHGAPPDESPAGRCPVCGRVYCIGCAKANLRGNRFVCTNCDEALKLSDDHLKYLVKSFVEASG